MNDAKYQNEENIKQIKLRFDEIQTLNKQMDALQMTIDMKDEQIKNLKDSVVESEIKARKLLDRLNKSESGAAQSNID
jgi:cell division protein FtsB